MLIPRALSRSVSVLATAALALSGAALVAPAAEAAIQVYDLDDGVNGTTAAAWDNTALSINAYATPGTAASGTRLIQTFTASKTGVLAGISAMIRGASSTRFAARLSDSTTFVTPSGQDSAQFGPILATAQFSAPTSLVDYGSAQATFDQPVPIVAGHVYVVSFVRTDPGLDGDFGLHNLPGGSDYSQASFYYYAGGWNSAAVYRVLMGVIVTSPVTIAKTSAAAPSNGWYSKPVTATATCAAAVTDCPASIVFDSDGTYSVDSMVDLAGAAVGYLYGVKVDTTKPVLTGQVTTPISTGGVYESSVTVQWTCSDPSSGEGTSSGLATSCPADTVVTGVGSDTVATASVTDHAGNTTTTNVTGLLRRAGAPAITVKGPKPGAKFAYGTTVKPTCTAKGQRGNTVACTGTTAKKANPNGSTTWTYTAKAVDPKGTTSIKTLTWTVLAKVNFTITGLPKKKAGKTTLVVGKKYKVTALLKNAKGAKLGKPTWLKPVKSTKSGAKSTPTTKANLFKKAKGGKWTATFKPTKAMKGKYYEFGVLAPDGVTTKYVVVYVRR